MVLHCNQSSDVLVISKAIVVSFLPLPSDFPPREVQNLTENVKPHMKVSESNCLLLLRSSKWGKNFCHQIVVCFSLSLISIPLVFLAVFCNVWMQFIVPFVTKISLYWSFIHIAEHIRLFFFLSTQLHLSLLDPYLYVTCLQFQFIYIYVKVRGHFLFTGAIVPLRFIFLFSRP